MVFNYNIKGSSVNQLFGALEAGSSASEAGATDPVDKNTPRMPGCRGGAGIFLACVFFRGGYCRG